MAWPPVQVYALSTCVHCKAVRRLLHTHDIPFTYTDIDLLSPGEQDQFFRAILAHNPKKSFPVVIIGTTAIVGYQLDRIKKELGIP